MGLCTSAGVLQKYKPQFNMVGNELSGKSPLMSCGGWLSVQVEMARG